MKLNFRESVVNLTKDKTTTPLAQSDKKHRSEPPDNSPVILTIPLIKRDGEYRVTQKEIDYWKDIFPGVNVLQELKKCRDWNLDEKNVPRRKTKKGIRFEIKAKDATALRATINILQPEVY